MLQELIINKFGHFSMELTGSSLMEFYGVTGSEEIDLTATNDPIFSQATYNMDSTGNLEHKIPPAMNESDFHNSDEEPELTELRNAEYPEDVMCDLTESTHFTICSSFHVLNPSTPPLGLINEDDLELHEGRLLIKEEPLDLESDSCGYPGSDISSTIHSDDSGYSDFSHSINCEPETYMSDLWPVDNTVSIDSTSNDEYLYNHAKTEDIFNIPKMNKILTVCSESDSDSGDSIDKPARKKPGRKKGQVSKVLHLWEFIRDLLKDPEYSGRIIKWEDKSSGIFRIVKSSEVAILWGQKKKNKRTMTYEKMSRSLRYSRKEGYFGAVPKENRYPKKLCFKFGPKSKGWQ